MIQNIETVCTYSYWERHYLERFKKRLIKKAIREIIFAIVVLAIFAGIGTGFLGILKILFIMLGVA